MTSRQTAVVLFGFTCLVSPMLAAEGQPAARVGDTATDPTFGPVGIPCTSGQILGPGNATVIIAGAPAATLASLVFNGCGITSSIVTGSPTVLIGNAPAARVGDTTSNGGAIIVGAPTVLIGE